MPGAHELRRWVSALGLFAVVILGQSSAHAQMDPVFSHYYFNPLTTNPAYAGSRGVLSVNAVAREQWVGVAGSPSSQSFSLHSPLKNKDFSAGFLALKDQNGPIQNTSFYGIFAHSIQVSKAARLSFGVDAGINMYRADLQSLQGVSKEDPAFYNNASGKSLMPNIGFGLYYYAENYYLGLSTPKLLENPMSGTTENTNYKERRNYFAQAGMVFPVSPVLKIKPSMLLRYAPASSISVDINVNSLWRDRFWLGAMLRPHAAFGIMTAMQLNPQLRMGYTYEQTTNSLSGFSSGTHELFIGFDFDFKTDAMISPRYF